jgi:hypothetical protein
LVLTVLLSNPTSQPRPPRRFPSSRRVKAGATRGAAMALPLLLRRGPTFPQ